MWAVWALAKWPHQGVFLNLLLFKVAFSFMDIKGERICS